MINARYTRLVTFIHMKVVFHSLDLSELLVVQFDKGFSVLIFFFQFVILYLFLFFVTDEEFGYELKDLYQQPLNIGLDIIIVITFLYHLITFILGDQNYFDTYFIMMVFSWANSVLYAGNIFPNFDSRRILFFK